MSVTGLAPSEVVCWLDLHGITDSEIREWYYSMIAVLDEEFLEFVDKKVTKDA